MSKLFVKGIYLILIIIAIAIVFNQISSIMLAETEETESILFRKKAGRILDRLVSSEHCLAVKEEVTEKIIDLKSLEDFQSRYPDIEPECARSYDYGYSVKVEKFPMTRIKGTGKSPEIPPGNRDIVLIFDNSYSMRSPEKMNNAKKAAHQLVKCASETDSIAIVIFGPPNYCGVQELVPMTPLDSETAKENIINSINTGIEFLFGTPLIKSVDKASEVIKNEANPSKYRMIILLTDGRETCCDECKEKKGKENLGTNACRDPCENTLCDHARYNLNYLKNENIPVFSIFLGEDIKGIQEAGCVAEETGGEFYSVSSPEILEELFCELVSGVEEVVEEYQSWYFGSRDHSEYDALKASISLSIPVVINMTEIKVQPGLITIKMYKGELEELVGLIDRTCETGLETEKLISLSYPVKLKDDYLCMEAEKEFCRKFACKSVEFDKISSSGTYTFFFRRENNVVKVMV